MLKNFLSPDFLDLENFQHPKRNFSPTRKMGRRGLQNSRLFGLRKFFNIRNEIFHRRAKWDGAVCKSADFLDLVYLP